MRQIATLPDESTARKFTDFLLTLKIATRVLPEGEQFGVWVCDEDQVAVARLELQQFTQHPDDVRYTQAIPAAKELRRKEERLEKDFRRRSTRLRDRMEGSRSAADRPLTIALITISVLVTLASGFMRSESPTTQALVISPFSTPEKIVERKSLPETAARQPWRLVTPIFLHGGIIHLLFNCLILLSLGGQVESVRGTPRFLVMVLALAIVSNVCEYYLSWNIKAHPVLAWEEHPNFGGMSGVIYGLFGYLWMKSRYFPDSKMYLGSDTVIIMLGWFALCAFGFLANIANVAHASGLLLGIIIGIAPRLWQR